MFDKIMISPIYHFFYSIYLITKYLSLLRMQEKEGAKNNLNKFITENPCFNYENYHSNVRLSRPKSTSSIISDNRAYYRHQNLNDSGKKYIDFYNIYYQKFMEEKTRRERRKRKN